MATAAVTSRACSIPSTGLIGIATAENLWVGGVAGRGVHQVDLRSELSESLRNRPGTSLGYQFVEELGVNCTVEKLRVRATRTVKYPGSVSRCPVA